MADQNSKPMCLTCRFFVNQTPYGACQRYPSIVQKHEMSWCGEYAAVVVNIKSNNEFNDKTRNEKVTLKGMRTK